MRQLLIVPLMALIAVTAPARSSQANSIPGPHYLFVWAGDKDKKGNDFIAVIDADAASPSCGRMLTTVAADQKTAQVHHTEYSMPESAMLFANDHEAGRTFLFDLRDARHPKVAASFLDMDGYMHPHSYVRLPNGHVLATFQHSHHSGMQGDGKSGGLVEIDDAGKVIRSASSADPAFSDALLMPYGLVALPQPGHERHLPPALDGLGPRHAALGSDVGPYTGGPSLPSETRPVQWCSLVGRCLS